MHVIRTSIFEKLKYAAHRGRVNRSEGQAPRQKSG